MKPAPPKCYACDAPAAGHALKRRVGTGWTSDREDRPERRRKKQEHVDRIRWEAVL